MSKEKKQYVNDNDENKGVSEQLPLDGARAMFPIEDPVENEPVFRARVQLAARAVLGYVRDPRRVSLELTDDVVAVRVVNQHVAAHRPHSQEGASPACWGKLTKKNHNFEITST
jgi:hypothetical protein